MNLEVVSIWSPDLANHDSPEDINDFDVFLQISLKEQEKKGVKFLHAVFAHPICLRKKNREVSSNPRYVFQNLAGMKLESKWKK